MQPLTRLKISAVVFSVLWIVFMILWSGTFDRVGTVILTVCGAAGGYGWYRGMRWYFGRSGLLSTEDRTIDPRR